MDGSTSCLTVGRYTPNATVGAATSKRDAAPFVAVTVVTPTLITNGIPAYSERHRYAGDFKDGYAVVQRDDGKHSHIGPVR